MITSTSIHYALEREVRSTFINQEVGYGNVIESFVVDRGHVKGTEIHKVTDTAVIIIENSKTHKVITAIIARPEQLKRLYRTKGKVPPSKLVKLAYKHTKKKYNEI